MFCLSTRLGVVHLHIVIAALLTLLLFLVVLAVFNIDLLAALFVIVCGGSSCVLRASHGGVFARCTVFGFDFLFLFLVLLVRSVLLAVCGKIGLWLLRRELRRCRLLRIPEP
jgi:hypothetical protein